MRLAEALAERKALDARLSSIEGRLRANARIQEGDAVSEDPERLFALLDSTAEELRTLMVRIARTNRETVVDGRPLADWIAERDVSVRRFNILSGVADRASERIERRSADDVRVVPVIDVVARKHEADALAAPSYDRHGGPGSVRSVTTFSTARRHAELDALALRINAIDARIQQANWETELL